jgi:beta-fructofuranosidase
LPNYISSPNLSRTEFSNESLIIDRSNSSAAALTTDGIATNNEAGRLRLFDIQVAGESDPCVETLNLTILVDNSVVEVYANDRFVLSTWIWTWFASSNKIAFYHEGSDAVEFGEVNIYEGLVDAWLERSR